MDIDNVTNATFDVSLAYTVTNSSSLSFFRFQVGPNDGDTQITNFSLVAAQTQLIYVVGYDASTNFIGSVNVFIYFAT